MLFRERPGYHYILTKQTAIAAVLSNMDAEIAALEARRDKTRALKQGMRQERLVGPGPANKGPATASACGPFLRELLRRHGRRPEMRAIPNRHDNSSQ